MTTSSLTRRGLRCIPSIAVACAIALSCTQSAHASVDLIAIGTLTDSSAGSYTDLSGLTGTLENGLPANLLGGIGSGLAYAGGNTFIGLPDRGPNATPYNGAVDNTASYIPRLQTLTMGLSATPSGGLPYTLIPTLTSTTLLYSSTALTYGSLVGNGTPAQNRAGIYYFSGRSDNYNASLSSTNPHNGRLDPEAIRVSNDGKSVFVSDEYGPYVYQFDRATGERIKTFTLPDKFAVANSRPQETAEISDNTSGRISNKGMEGLAITPDGKTLVGIMQQNLIQDKKKSLRIVTIDIATGATTHEYDYQLTDGSSVSDIVAINDHQFLVDERDGAGLGDGSTAAVKKIYKIDFANAQDVGNKTGDLSAYKVTKTDFLDVRSALNAMGITDAKIPAKLEGITFGQDIVENGVTKHTLYVANDNDFLQNLGNIANSNPNQFYVFSFTDSDLPGFAPQQVAPVPLPAAAYLLMSGLGLLGGAIRRRKTI